MSSGTAHHSKKPSLSSKLKVCLQALEAVCDMEFNGETAAQAALDMQRLAGRAIAKVDRAVEEDSSERLLESAIVKFLEAVAGPLGIADVLTVGLPDVNKDIAKIKAPFSALRAALYAYQEQKQRSKA